MSGSKVLIILLTLTGVLHLRAADFNGAEALQFTAKAVSFGARPAGTEANHKLQAYINSELRSFGCAPVEDAFRAETPLGPKEMKNIIAKIPGTSGKAIVITGHYDTKPMPGILFVGANDGGSSTGFLLELAKVLCRQHRKDDVYLVWLDGEEAFAQWTDKDSLYGSKHLAQKWSADGMLKRVKALINVDMIGDKDLSIIYEQNSTGWLRDLTWKAANEAGVGRHFSDVAAGIEDDHIPFLKAGAPALDLIDFDYGPNNSYWHTARDTLDKLSADSFTVVGKTLITLLKKLEER
jgi:Zn-dependent M28 family amino/carboxypeptidase